MDYPTTDKERADWFSFINTPDLDSPPTRRPAHKLKKPHLNYEERNCVPRNSSAFPGYMPWELPPMGESTFESFYKTLTFNFNIFETSSFLEAERPMTGASRSRIFTMNDEDKEDKPVKTTEQYAVESMNRTRKIFSRIIMHNYSDKTRLGTLTYAQPCHNLDEHWKNLNLMTQRFRKEYNADLNYIAVPELHPGGHGWHWHIVINNNWFDYKVFQAKIWCLGIVMISERPQAATSNDGRNMANYLVKYIGKEIHRSPKYKKRYSRGGDWATDWQVTDGVARGTTSITRRLIAYLASMSIPYRLTTIRPYDGQVIHSTSFASGLYPALPWDTILHPEERLRLCDPPPEKSLTREDNQLGIPYEV